jgi:L,D-peptidoglycan transpeptidase YkuD (ErfK/YbiS/YcfS/YnhG family)
MLFALLGAALAATCPSNLANDLPAAPAGRQLITVEASSTRTTYARLQTWKRVSGCWVSSDGPFSARVGRNGVSSNRREGDGTTPTGTYTIGTTMYGNSADPGVRYRYRKLRCGDWWSEDSTSPTYNTFQHVTCGEPPPFKIKTSGMWQQPVAYAHLAVIDFNTRPAVPGRGSGIFLHAQTGRSTNGCISLRHDELVRVLRWLDPKSKPRIVIGTRAQLHGLR